jgi:DNA replication protein DnaC
MLTEPTIDKLKNLHLYAMAEAWNTQKSDARSVDLDFDTRFGMLVDAEQMARDNKKIARLLREAKLRISNACIEDIDFSAKRELDKSTVRQLASCRWITEHLNVIVTGATGTGKTYFACALGQQACRAGYRVLYRRMPRLLEELALAHADGSYSRLLAKLARVDVLLLDDWALAPLRDQERRDMLEIFEDRHAARSTIFTSQMPPDTWHDYLGDPTIADAICDRVLHNSQRIKLKGPSRRKENSHVANEV